MDEKTALSRADTLCFFNGDELATDVFLKKYALTNPDGVIEEYLPSQMWARLAKAAASIEEDKDKWEKSFYNVLDGWKAIPQGSVLFALGNSYQKSSFSNCFVIPIQDDSLESIFECAKEMSKTYAYRGGVGIDISVLRPAGAKVTNAARTSTGAWSFMDFYSYVTRLIGQHGRRGALMITMSDTHPDLLNFITAKTDKTKITGANISVKLSDAFMDAVAKEKDWTLSFTTKHETFTKTMPATIIWDLIVETATNTAEPGILFWDTILRESPADCYADEGFQTMCCNPCAEIPLAFYDACTLLAMNLTKYTRNDFQKDASFDFDAFDKDVKVAVRFMDNVKEMDLKLMPLKQQRQIAAKGRRIGMGTTGLGDTLANLGIKYDSDKAIEFVDQLFQFYAKSVYKSSVALGKEKGVFPIFNADKEKDNPFLKRIGFAGVPRRNIACLTCAPTGSISCICQTSSGVEPVFRNFYTRRRKITHNESVNVPKNKLSTDKLGDLWQEYDVAHHNVQRYLKIKNIDLNSTSANEIALPKFFVESNNIDWKNRVKIQSTMQKWIDHSISSTCNVPSGTSKEVVKSIYMEAYKQGNKGFTVYVDGCRDGVLNTRKDCKDCIQKTDAPKRPKSMDADVHHITVKGQLYFCMIGLLRGDPYEVFAGQNGIIDKKIKKAQIIKRQRGHYEALLDDGTLIENIGTYITNEQAAVTRLGSLALRHGADIKHCVDVLEKVPGDLHNFAHCISRVLKKYIAENSIVTGFSCPDCGSGNIVRADGCKKCNDCGWTACQ